jgi:hypothetical protein
MIGKIFVTSSGYDPEKGKDVKDPYLGPKSSLGACRPDIREKLQQGDHIFVVSGKVRNVDQFVIGGFEIKEKITAFEAYERFPEQRLVLLPNGRVSGNVIVTGDGKQHALDHHNQFERRIKNYIVGTNTIILLTPEEIAEGRLRTLEILRDVFGIKGDSIRDLMGRNRNMLEKQILKLRAHLDAVKSAANKPLEQADIAREMSISTRAAVRAAV